MDRENQTGWLHRNGERDGRREVAQTSEEHEALLDHHIEEMLVTFSALARIPENTPRDAERSTE